jgi:hypothetical protein
LHSWKSRLTSKFPGLNPMSSSSARALVPPDNPDIKTTTAKLDWNISDLANKPDPATFILSYPPARRLQHRLLPFAVVPKCLSVICYSRKNAM